MYHNNREVTNQSNDVTHTDNIHKKTDVSDSLRIAGIRTKKKKVFFTDLFIELESDFVVLPLPVYASVYSFVFF
jgi:hypothetical protein